MRGELMRVARKIELSSEERAVLEQQARGRSLPVRLRERSRIVLRSANGLQDREIAAELGITPKKVARWRNRFLEAGKEALAKDAPRP
jgi:DNA-directed RNA polymerase specialized sigma24 family protein